MQSATPNWSLRLGASTGARPKGTDMGGRSAPLAPEENVSGIRQLIEKSSIRRSQGSSSTTMVANIHGEVRHLFLGR
jgi:hypothetical protein